MTDQFLHCPNVVSQSGFHSRGDAKCLVDAAQAKPRHEDMNGVSQVFKFATMRIRSAGKPFQVDAQTQVGSFDVASGNVTRIGMSASDAWDRPRYPANGAEPIVA